MEEQQITGRVLAHPLVPEIKHSYLDYAMSVIIGRALPDVRDGLKPVQRRVLYGMMGLGIRHNQAYKKSARVVGEVMGKYHPHGDSSIYDTMVRLAQPWNLRYPLVDGQGNFGSVDGDSAAAMRYTEARFSELGELMLQDIDEDTVDWAPNFDESLQEPMTLPCMMPNLLVNGSTGIAVGMATNMPTHNLGEVVDALCCLISKPDVELGELMTYLPGPDFPTGGIIMGREGIIDAYRTGRGKIVVRGRCHVEETKRKTSVVITEIPYMVNKTTMIEGIVKCVQTHAIDGVADLRDESDRQGLRVVLDLTRDGDPELVQRQLYNRTMMQSTFGVINLALVNQRPVELTLKQMLEEFLTYRRSVVCRRTAFRLAKAEAREHIIEGLCRALDMIDEVIRVIRGASDTDAAKKGLIEELQFSDKQAQAILDMRLQRLTGLEREKLLQEMAQLLTDIARYKEILGDPHVLDGVIRNELVELRRKFSDERRTEIQAHVENSGDSYEDLLPEEDIVVTLSQDGYLRRTPLKDYGVQNRGGKGRKGAVLTSEDQVSLVDVTSTHSDIMLFTSRGRVFAIRGHVIPETKSGKGRQISKFISLNEGETVVALKGTFTEDHHTVLFVTRRGIAKRMDIAELNNLTRAGRQVLSLDEGDEIAKVRTTRGTDDLLFVSRRGRGLRVSEDEIRTMGRSARGVKAMKLNESDEIVSCEVIAESRQILLVSERGIGKRTSYDEFSVHHRATGGMRAMGISDRTGNLAVATSVSLDDEVVLMTANGRMVRLLVSDIPQLGRGAAGSYLVRPDEGDSVAGISVIHKGEESEETNAVPVSKPLESEIDLPFGDEEALPEEDSYDGNDAADLDDPDPDIPNEEE